MKGILVAAGFGEQVAPRRWRGSGLRCPSLESPPVDRAIDAFARAGFEEVAVVVGHNEDVLWHYLEDSARYGISIYCLHNAQHLRGAATAVCAARAFVGGEPFVVALSSHAVTVNVLLSLRARATGAHALSVEKHPRHHSQGDGAVRVWLDEQGCVRGIGQCLRHWHAISTGAFLFQPTVFARISELLRGAGACSMTTLVRHMIACDEAPYGCEVSPQWVDVLGSEHLLAWTTPILSARLAA